MEAASGATYISGKYMQAYEAKRKEHLAKKANKLAQLQVIMEEKAVIKPKSSVQAETEAKKEEDVVDAIGTQPQQLQQEVQKKEVKIENASDSDDDDESDKDDRRYMSCEEVHSDELEGELNLSDCEDMSNVRNVRAQKKQAKASYKMAPARIFRQEIDTNIFKIGFKTLSDAAELATGDPTSCEKCKAIFNVHSKIEEEKSEEHDSTQVWPCEFCSHKNPVDIEEDEKPKNKAVNFILEAAAQVQDKKAQGKQDISVVFCIDQSGSMCCSQAIQGKHQIKGDKTSDLQEFMKFSDGSDQRLQGERNVTYVSRMQCLQAAIDQQITDMSNGATERKLGIVSFNNEVTIYGDGGQDPVTVGGDKLMDQEYLMSNGAQQGQERMKLTVKDSAKQLQKKLMSLEETGPTALGPAVATSIAMAAASGVQGSQVVICTDGLANVGLGSFDEAKTDDDFAAIEKFYTTLGEFAKDKGLTINIISIIGDECNLDSLTKLAEMTGGEVERVNPVELTNNFANILSQPIIASNVVAKVKLHQGMTFRNENPDHIDEDGALMTREIGNVTAETEITFEYTMKKISQLVKMEDFDLTKVKDLPFQVQITYKALDGSKCIRVITETKPISSDRQQLEQQANFQILGQNAIQQSANIARSGNVRFAQANAKQWKRKMGNIASTADQKKVHSQYMERFNNVYSKMQCQEDMIQMQSIPQKKMAKKAAPRSRGMMMKRQASGSDEESDASDVEDNANSFGAAFNENARSKAKKAEAKKSKGGFLSGLFGGSKSKGSNSKGSAGRSSDIRLDQAEMAMPKMSKMQAPMQEAMIAQPQMNTMMMNQSDMMMQNAELDQLQQLEQEEAMDDLMMQAEQVEQVESSAFEGKSKKSKAKAKAPPKRFHQDDALASDLYKATKFNGF